MIGTGLTEEQVLNSFIDLESHPEPARPTKPETIYRRGLSVNMLDIWSSNDEDAQDTVDVWEGERD